MVETVVQQPSDSTVARRQRWMGALAKAPLALLEEAWQGLAAKPAYVFLRKPEIGLCMIRGRAGGTGTRFNLGDMTMTRAAIRLASGTTGFGYVAGRVPRQAELAAVFDALLQEPASRHELERRLIAPIEAAARQRRQAIAAKAATTKVEFFTLARGEDPK